MSYVKVTSPNGGEMFAPGQTVNITWQTTYAGLNNCRIAWGKKPDPMFPKDEFFPFYDITPYPAGTANTGSYPWTIPSNITQETLGKITVYCQGGGVIIGTPQSMDSSDGAFTIKPAAAATPTTTPSGSQLTMTIAPYVPSYPYLGVSGTFTGTPARIGTVLTASGAMIGSSDYAAIGTPNVWGANIFAVLTHLVHYTVTATAYDGSNHVLGSVSQSYIYP